MIEIPEAIGLSNQIAEMLSGKKVMNLVAGASPHKWAWFQGDRDEYADMAIGQSFTGARAVGGFVECFADETSFAFGEGINLRFAPKDGKLPKKHQLLVEFEDGSAFTASVQMYGWIGVYPKDGNSNEYFHQAAGVPSPLDASFTHEYFDSLLAKENPAKLSAKAFLATEQRIPGFGNGVLQDVLYNAGIHPKRKMDSLDSAELQSMYTAIRDTISLMATEGGRDTELDLLGNACGYRTRVSRNTVGQPCPKCGTLIEKAAYLGGSVYFCATCQPIK
jgi:formamidopyrimidine-DNA glycosylase